MSKADKSVVGVGLHTTCLSVNHKIYVQVLRGAVLGNTADIRAFNEKIESAVRFNISTEFWAAGEIAIYDRQEFVVYTTYYKF